MKAIDEIKRLQAKIDSGDMSPDEPLFVLRGQDQLSGDTVRFWAELARECFVPSAKVNEAEQHSLVMDAWPVKQVAGRPETRTTAEKIDWEAGE